MSSENQNTTESQSVVSMRATEIIVAVLLLAFGLTIAIASYSLGAQWADDGPQAGYFPFYIGAIIALSSLVTLVQALLDRTSGGQRGFVERGQLKQVLLVLLPALTYVLGIQWFGIYLASAVYMAVFMIWLGKYAWWKAVPLAIAVSALLFVTFEIWFQVALHKGTLYNPLSLFGY